VIMHARCITRRRFLGAAAAAAAAAPYVITSTALGARGRAAASERIVVGAIGCGMRSEEDMHEFMNLGNCQMTAICDVLAEARQDGKARVDKHYGNGDCKVYHDFRDVLARDDIDAVTIATPDHWHALITVLACQAGKDVFCEKPESLTVRQGRAMVNAARKYGCMVSGGSQRILGDYGNWARLVRGGAIGELREIYVRRDWPSQPCDLPAQPTPPGVDWDLWLGPAPWRAFNARLMHGGWRPYRDYSGGGATDWGAHRMGGAVFAANLHKTGPVEVIPPDGEDHQYLTFVYANGVKIYYGGSMELTFVGTEGTLPGNCRPLHRRVYMEGYKGIPLRDPGNAQQALLSDFLHSVRTRQFPFRDIEQAHRTVTLCHLGNIANWLKRPLKWDPVKEEILGDAEASRWLDRAMREPWRL